MKRIIIFSLLLFISFSLTVFADGESNVSFHEREIQARELTREVLAGRQIQVRIYNDWQTDLRTYKLVNVPVADLSVNHNAVKKAFADINESTIIVIVGKDQLDEAVAAVIGDFVYVDTYGKNKRLNIWPSWSLIPDYKYWIFTDALGNPIPQAKVEIRLVSYIDRQEKFCCIDKVVLDKMGQLKPLILSNSRFRFDLIVSHPKYGKAIVAGYYDGRQSDGRFVLPLVSAESEAASRATTGYVVDTQGNALEAMPIECGFFHASGIDNPPRAYGAACGRAITDEQGWFSVYIPIEKEGVLSTELIPPAAQFHLSINPPISSNLHEYDNSGVVVGSELMITMAAMNPDENFHTFTFMDGQDVITDLQELEKIKVVVFRGSSQRLWRILKYDDFEDGCDLPEGILRAETRRWNQHFSFRPIEITAESPEELVFEASKQIIYEGTVVEGKTGQPMPNVLVLVKHIYPREGFSELTDKQLQLLRAKVLSSDFDSPTGKALYEFDDRVTLTDENGCYQFIFKTGLREYLDNFIALETGYVAEESVYGGRHRPNDDGITVLAPIKLLSSKFSPLFVFEDEFTNIITNPNIFEHIRFEIERADGRRWGTSYSNLINTGLLTRGIYYATLDWQQLHYVYEPVKVTADSTQEVVFKVKEVKRAGIAYQGRVVNGITGEPMPGAVVMSQFRIFDRLDGSGIQPAQWNAIHSLGPEPDPNDPALIPLREAFEFNKIMRADVAGQFQITLERKIRRHSLIAVEQDYLGARFDYRPETDRYEGLEPDADGYVKLPPMKLYPAATITIEPNLPYTEGTKHRVRFYFRTLLDDLAPWLSDFRATPRAAKGASVLYKYDLKPNQFQTVYVLAGRELFLKINPMLSRKAPATIRNIKLKQGQFLDLGRQDFQQTFGVTVKVIDSAGMPVEGLRVGCRDMDGFLWGSSRGHIPITDENGKVVLYVPPYSNGEFLVVCPDRLSEKRLEEGIPYKIAGQKEDAGRVFSLQLSDEILSCMYEQNLFRRRSP